MIEKEIKILSDIRDQADIIIDTSSFNVHQLKSFIVNKFKSNRKKNETLVINIISFGYKHGIPRELDMLIDVRFLPNPYFDDKLKDMSGLEQDVQKFVKSTNEFKTFFPKLKDLLLFLVPKYKDEGKFYLNVAFGCTGGRHRSVTVAEEVVRLLGEKGFNVLVDHRDIHLIN